MKQVIAPLDGVPRDHAGSRLPVSRVRPDRGASKGSEHGVPLRIDLLAVIGRESGAQQGAALVQQYGCSILYRILVCEHEKRQGKDEGL